MGLSIYIHIPFCKTKCAYCDFFSITNLDGMQLFIDALEKEIHTYASDERLAGGIIDSIFFGGGTPSLIRPNDIEALIKSIARSFPFAPDAETSMEINPDDMTNSKLNEYIAVGINRFSLGVQSLDNSELRILQRRHNADSARSTINLLRNHDVNFSVDLIYGIPNQSVDSWLKTLTSVIELTPRHISIYCLTLEDGTKLQQSIQSGVLSMPDDEITRAMYLSAIEMLTESELVQYEISNFARDGFECYHNMAYWTGKPYLGLGPSAASYVHPFRWKNVSDIDRYVTAINQSGKAISEIDKITPDTALREYIMLSLRLTKGIDLMEYSNRFGANFISAHRELLERYRSHGLINIDSDFISLTPEGMFVSNEIISNLI